MDEITKLFLRRVAEVVRYGKIKLPLRFYLIQISSDSHEIPIYEMRWDSNFGDQFIEPLSGNLVEALVKAGFAKSIGGLNYQINHQNVLIELSRLAKYNPDSSS